MNIKRFLATTLFAIPVVCLLMWKLSALVWLPDLISPDATLVIARCALANGETIELTQHWVGDGYSTGVCHHRTDDSSVFVLGDADGARIFRCQTAVRTNDSFVLFQFGRTEWHYYWGGPFGGQFLTCGDGQTREAM